MKKLFFLCSALLFAVVTMGQTPTVSASSVTFKYCQTTFGNVQLSYLDNPSWHGENFTPGTHLRTIQNVRGCDSVVTVTVERAQGAILSAFSVSATKQVWFSKGNLQFCAVPEPGHTTTHQTRDGAKVGIWRFAEHQYDYVGDYNSNASKNKGGNVYVGSTKCNNSSRAEDYQGWIDQYEAGCTGYQSYCSNCSPRYSYFYPWGRSGYGDVIGVSAGSSTAGTNFCFGYYNAISNGGNKMGSWYLLTRDEWLYLFQTRTNASSKYSVGKVNNVPGLILLPDDWTLPAGVSFTARASSVNTNNYNVTNWQKMEDNGAVFLPGMGDKFCTGQFCTPADGACYWMADVKTTGGYGGTIYCLTVQNATITYSTDTYRSQKSAYAAVRLVRTVQ